MKRGSRRLILPVMLALGMLGSAADLLADCTSTFLPYNGGQGFTAPNIRFRYIRAIYLITESELMAGGLTSGASLSGIGWKYYQGPGFAGTGTLAVYLQNTTDTTNTRSLVWTDAIAGMTLVHNAPTTLPAGPGSFTIPFSGGAPLVYEGGGLYVAFDWQYPTGALSSSVFVSCNVTGYPYPILKAWGTTPPAYLVADYWRPETTLMTAVAHTDAGVKFISALGALPRDLISPLPQTVQATITNRGDLPLNGVPVTLTVSGADTFTDTRAAGSMAACGGTSTVTFAPFAPGALGTDTLTVSVPADGAMGNNSLSLSLDIGPNRYSYEHPETQPSGGMEDRPGELLARFTIGSATQLDAVIADFFAANAAPYRLVVRGDDGTGKPGPLLYADAADRTVSAAGIVSLRPPSPVAVGPGNIFAGIRQNSGAPLSFNDEVPRPGTFFSSTTPDTGPWTDFSQASINARLNLGAVFGPCLVPMTVDVIPSGTTTICAGSFALLNAAVSGGTGPYSYEWTENGNPVAGVELSTFEPFQAASGAFTYNCEVTDSGGCINMVDGAPPTVVWLPDGSGCDDGNGCTATDTCAGGACLGTPVTVPGEVMGVTLRSDKRTLVWDSASSAGPGTVHDVSRGLVNQLPVGSGASEICLATVSAATTTDGTTPNAGFSFWYLVRGRNGCGSGTYGAASDSAPRITSVCP